MDEGIVYTISRIQALNVKHDTNLFSVTLFSVSLLGISRCKLSVSQGALE